MCRRPEPALLLPFLGFKRQIEETEDGETESGQKRPRTASDLLVVNNTSPTRSHHQLSANSLAASLRHWTQEASSPIHDLTELNLDAALAEPENIEGDDPEFLLETAAPSCSQQNEAWDEDMENKLVAILCLQDLGVPLAEDQCADNFRSCTVPPTGGDGEAIIVHAPHPEEVQCATSGDCVDNQEEAKAIATMCLRELLTSSAAAPVEEAAAAQVHAEWTHCGDDTCADEADKDIAAMCLQDLESLLSRPKADDSSHGCEDSACSFV